MDDELRLNDWFEADRRVAAQPRPRQVMLDRLADRLAAELARRLGRPFMLAELVREYESGTDWAIAQLHEQAPGEPWAWAPDLAVDAAFARYARFARDVGGGRRIGVRDR